ncbi:natterin-3 [Tetranychus urticae]|uniref:Natterin-3 n=1 Tax=Tetranychus urticae TaxID=32264 RepID=T1K378_TETUR|nr:natterin-3 [Tetranychus urticae]
MSEFYYNRHQGPKAHWIDAEGGFVPYGEAVVGGMDISGETLYVGRALQDGECIPGKIVPSHGVCYVAYAGREHPHRVYQVLRGHGLEFCWVPSSEGMTPTGAIEGGKTSDGESLFIGRTFHQGSHVIGKIHPSHGRLYIPFGGDEHSFSDYEVLCMKTVSL